MHVESSDCSSIKNQHIRSMRIEYNVPLLLTDQNILSKMHSGFVLVGTTFMQMLLKVGHLLHQSCCFKRACWQMLWGSVESGWYFRQSHNFFCESIVSLMAEKYFLLKYMLYTCTQVPSILDLSQVTFAKRYYKYILFSQKIKFHIVAESSLLTDRRTDGQMDGQTTFLIPW